ncbi:MAG TPA: 4Fe-4S dicluster domain-containing protein [Ignavibacteriaceae bacterium]|nr:4Fe-4S dicluster domain-containing protein [Ignavibacteriaceae bacterium]
MEKYSINIDSLKNLVVELIEKNWNVVSSERSGIRYSTLKDANDFYISSKTKPSNISVKQFFFPKTEPLFFFKKEENGIILADPVFAEENNLLLGIKPCDAAAIPIISKVFNWDYKDEFFNKRVENSVVIGLSCNYQDSECFCTSVGLSQSSTKGSDIFFSTVDDNNFEVQVVTEKGKKFIEVNKKYFAPLENESPIKDAYPPKFEYLKAKEWLDKNFENEYWNKAGELCLGCAQCAFVCPTCHCFDIVDEDCGYDCGRRVKNWDACQFGLFTKHASGHNPRDVQTKRYRQRVNHKFKYYMDKFDEILCTGCGRCSRGCPAGINIGNIVEEISSLH